MDRRLNYRKKMRLLSVVARLRARPGTLPWRTGVCVLLGAFIVYNPFFAVYTSPGPAPAVQHPLSYRSTIASCELGCATVQLTKASVFPLEALVLVGEESRLQQRDNIRREPIDEPVPAGPQDFAASLWSRPPPIF